jgi:hypothetical protein
VACWMARGRILSIDQELERSQSELRSIVLGAQHNPSDEASDPMEIDWTPDDRYLLEMARRDVSRQQKRGFTRDIIASWREQSITTNRRISPGARKQYELDELITILDELRPNRLDSIRYTLFPHWCQVLSKKIISTKLETNNLILDLIISLVDKLIAIAQLTHSIDELRMDPRPHVPDS